MNYQKLTKKDIGKQIFLKENEDLSLEKLFYKLIKNDNDKHNIITNKSNFFAYISGSIAALCSTGFIINEMIKNFNIIFLIISLLGVVLSFCVAGLITFLTSHKLLNLFKNKKINNMQQDNIYSIHKFIESLKDQANKKKTLVYLEFLENHYESSPQFRKNITQFTLDLVNYINSNNHKAVTGLILEKLPLLKIEIEEIKQYEKIKTAKMIFLNDNNNKLINQSLNATDLKNKDINYREVV